MEMESSGSIKPGFPGRVCGGLKDLFVRFKGKINEAVKETKQVGQDDPRRIIHSLKVALALTIVSLIYYTRPLYNGFGVAGMWALLTVVVVFEYTVGGTISKGLNRGFATLLAGALGVGANYLANLTGEKGEPYLLGLFVFILGGTSTFLRFFPSIKKRYDYGVAIFILTFCLVTVSGYRAENVIQFAHKRLVTIIIGGAACMIISIFICPVWAGEDLQNLLAHNMEKLATFLEGFGGEYFGLADNRGVDKNDKSFLQGYKSVLNTKQTEDSLANFAWWEPGHGSFGFRHPWKQYLKIAGLIRQCAYHIEALNGYLNADLQGPLELRRMIQEPCTKMSSESGKALKELASSLMAMTRPSSVTTHIQTCKAAINELKAVLEAFSAGKPNLLEIIPIITVASLLIDISKCVENVSQAMYELSDQASFKATKSRTPMSEKLQILRRSTVKPLPSGEDDQVVIIVNNPFLDSAENHSPRTPETLGQLMQM